MNNIIGLSPRQLRQAADLKERIEALQQKLSSLVGVTTEAAPVKASKVGRPRMAKRTMSAANKAKMAALMKARCAKAKKTGKAKL
jgi:hypothetical protein